MIDSDSTILDSRPLLVPDLLALATIVEAATRSAKIRFFDDNMHIVTGTARSIGLENGNFDYNIDIRDLWLRVTTTTGFERFIPVMKMVENVQAGGFALDD